jgi:nitroreductase
LLVVISGKNFEYNEKYSITYQFDAEAAWEKLALEASSRGLVAHGMQGFDYEKARIDLEIHDNFNVMAMIAIGKKGLKENLPLQLQEKEFSNIENH